MKSDCESDSPTMETDLLVNREIVNLDHEVTCEIVREISTNEDGTFTVQCNQCNNKNYIKNFLEWTNGQSKIKTVKCKKCTKTSVIKICTFVNHRHTNSKFIPDIYYKIYSCANTVIRSVFHNCVECKKQRNIRAIPQTEVTAQEEYVCNCLKINTVQIKPTELNLKTKKCTTQKRTEAPKITKDVTNLILSQNPFELLQTNSSDLNQEKNEIVTSRSHSASTVSDQPARSRSQSLKRPHPYEGEGVSQAKKATRRKETIHCSLKGPVPIEPNRSTRSSHVPPILITDERYKYRNNKDTKKMLSDQLVRDLTKVMSKYHGRIARNERSKNILITLTDLEKRAKAIEDIKCLKPDLVFIAPKPKAEQIATTKVVIRNMGHDNPVEEQKDEMEKCIGIRPLNIKKITSDVQLCIFSGDFSYNEIAERMKNATEAFYCAYKLKPEKYQVSSDRVLQCKNCFKFNHATSACHAPKREPTIQIKNNQNESVRVCSNCKDVQPEQHIATQRKCPVFKKAIERQKNKSERREEQRTNVPLNPNPTISNQETNRKSRSPVRRPIIQQGKSFAQAASSRFTSNNESELSQSRSKLSREDKYSIFIKTMEKFMTLMEELRDVLLN